MTEKKFKSSKSQTQKAVPVVTKVTDAIYLPVPPFLTFCLISVLTRSLLFLKAKK